MSKNSFGPLDFFLRWLFALALVSSTYNPSAYSFYHWVTGPSESLVSLQVLAGLVLLIASIIYLRATWRSIGVVGIVLAVAVLASLIWLLVDLGWLALDSEAVVGWIAVVVVATVMGIGMSWSHIRRQLSGQFDTDETDD